MFTGGGTVVARYDYDPYGRSTTVLGTTPTDFNFTGLYRHSKSNLDLATYRAYDPDLGRWLSRDPIGEMGGLNLYWYVRNEPVGRIDPLGLTDYTPEQIADARSRISSGIPVMQDALFRLSGPNGSYQQFLVDRQRLGDAGQIMQTTGKNSIIDSWEHSYASLTFGLYGAWTETPFLFARDKAGWAEQWLLDELARSYDFLDYLKGVGDEQKCPK